MRYRNSLGILSICCLTLLGCREDAVLDNAPPIFGFGDLEASLEITGDTLELTVYSTRALPQDQSIDYELAGTALPGTDFSLLGSGTLVLPAGETEASLLFTALPNDDPDRLDRFILVELQPTADLRLAEERQLARIDFSLEHTVNLKLWAPDEAFPILWAYTSFGPEPVPDGGGLSAGAHFAFAYASKTEPNVIGLYNPVPGRSTNALNLHRIYSDYEVSSGSANIRMPNLIRLIPAEPGTTFGRAEIIPQRVTIVRRASSGLPPFEIGLSGEGTYDEVTGQISVAIYFDETELGNGDNVLRRYVFESEERE
jgi:hypothetical protein